MNNEVVFFALISLRNTCKITKAISYIMGWIKNVQV